MKKKVYQSIWTFKKTFKTDSRNTLLNEFFKFGYSNKYNFHSSNMFHTCMNLYIIRWCNTVEQRRLWSKDVSDATFHHECWKITLDIITYKQNALAALKSKITDSFYLPIANKVAGTYNNTEPYKWPSRPNIGSTSASSMKSTGLFVYKQSLCAE